MWTLQVELLQVKTLGSNKYFCTFIDDVTRKTWIYVLKRKHEVLNAFKKFKNLVEKQSDMQPSIEFSKFCEDESLIREITPPYTPPT